MSSITPRGFRASFAALLLLAGSVAAPGNAAAQDPDLTQPTITISPVAGTYPTGPQAVTIDWSDDVLLDADSRIITFGNDDLTSAFSYSQTGNSTAQSTGVVTIQPGSNSLHAYICDSSSWGPNCKGVFITYTGPQPSVQVNAEAGTLTLPEGQTGATRFRVVNPGISWTRYGLSASCSWGSSSCAVFPDSITVAPGDSAWVDLSFVPPAGGSTVSLTASAASATSTATTTIQALTPPDPGFPGDAKSLERIERSACVTVSIGSGAASECGDLRVVHALPTTRVLNKARTPVLTYNSDHARPHPIVAEHLAGPAGTVPDSIRAVLMVNGAQVAAQRWRGWGADQTRRIALAFDASAYPTGVYTYSIEVKAEWLAGTQSTLRTRTGRMAIVNRSASPFGGGWWLAGVEQLVTVPGDTARLWIGGDGSTRVYRGNAGGPWVAESYDRPDTLYNGNSNDLGPVTVRTLPGRSEVWFDAQGRHRRTINLLQQYTEFRWDGGYLQQIVAPYSTAAHDTARYAFEYNNNPLATVRNLSRVLAPGIGGTRNTELRTDATGRVLRIREPSGDSIVYAYSGATRWMTGRTDRRGVAHSFGYLRVRFHTSVQPLNATQTATARVQAVQTLGMIGTSVRADSVHVLYDGPRTETCDCTWWKVDRWGAPTSIRDPYGSITAVRRNDPRFPGLVTETVAPNGFTSTATYDARGNPSSTTAWNPYGDGRSATTRIQWDPYWDKPILVLAPEGEVSLTGYDAYGRRSWEQVGEDSVRRVRYGYNAHTTTTAPGLPISVTMPGGITEQYGYDVRGNLSSVTNPLQVTTEILNDGLGRGVRTRIAVVTTPVVEFQQDSTVYDVMDQVQETIATGPAMSEVAQQWLHVRNAYDKEGNLLQVERWSVPDTAGVDTIITRWEYDLAGRPIAETAADTTPATWADNPRDSTFYDLAGNPVRTRTRRFAESLAANPSDSAGAYVQMQYDALNRLTRRILPAVRYEQRNDGMVTRTNLDMAFHRYPYYPNDGVGLRIPADTAVFGYSNTGQQTQADNANALVRREYYSNGQLLSDSLYIRSVGGGSFGDHKYRTEYRYDRNGRATEMLHPSQLRPAQGAAQGILGSQFSYDRTTGALSQVTDPLGNAFRYHYNVRGEPDSLVLPGGITHQYTYNTGGQLTRHRIRNAVTSAPRYSDAWLRDESYTYERRGKLTGSANQYGLKDTLAVQYSGLGQMAQSAHTFWGWDIYTNQETKYGAGEVSEHDALGNIVSLNRTGAYRVYAPDFWQAGQYGSNHASSGFGYEPGTGRQVERMEDSRGEWTEYDAGGNTVFTTVEPSPGWPGELHDRASFYDGGGRLWAVDVRRVENAIGRSPQYFTFEEYRLDALGRRVLVRARKNCERIDLGDDRSCSLSSVRRTVWAGDNELYEIQMPDNLAENDTAQVPGMPIHDDWLDPNLFWGRVAYTYGGGIDRPLSVVRMGYVNRQTPNENGLFRWDDFAIIPHWNAHGRAQTGTFHDGTRYRCRAGYTDWCVELDWPDGMFPYSPAPGAYAHWHGTLLTEKRDASGLLYRRNRYYDPVTARFTQEDPIGLAGGINAYGFAAGDPVSYSDPYGLCSVPTALGGVAFGYAVSRLAGSRYGWREAAVDAALGCVGAVGVRALARANSVRRARVATRVAQAADEVAEARHVPEIGRKLDYLFGRATGSAHNIERSREMARTLSSVGLNDTPGTRQMITNHLDDVLNDASSIVRTQDNGRVVRESLLMGPNGGAKLQTVWEGDRLITMNVFR